WLLMMFSSLGSPTPNKPAPPRAPLSVNLGLLIESDVLFGALDRGVVMVPEAGATPQIV
ncbi:hypothetical protein AMTR_s00004p00099350, partial [Amborella trichopoda]